MKTEELNDNDDDGWLGILPTRGVHPPLRP